VNVAELIGEIVAQFLKGELASERDAANEGTARYIIDSLSAEQMAAIARRILRDPELSDRVDLRLPERALQGSGLPDAVLTSHPATYFRNITIVKPLLLVATSGDDEDQSLKEFTRLGSPELQDRPELWVKVAAEGLSLTEQNAKWWEKALAGVLELRGFSLDRLGAYVLRTRAAVEGDGLPILIALGNALPALRLPRDSVSGNRVKEKSRGHVSAWKSLFSSMSKSRGCYLRKRTPSQLILGEDDLRSAFEKVKDAIPARHHEVVQRFIDAPADWNDEAAALAEIEWEEIKPLFDGMRREQFNLGKETLAFYEEREADLLSDEESEYLALLAKRSATEPDDADTAFYEMHRNELKEDRKLKSAWDRFIYGRPREAEDFLAGIAACMESLFSQGVTGSKRKLRIRCERATKKDLRDLNVDAELFFARRYAGLRSLFGDRVSWQVGQLFDFPKLVASWRTSARTPLNFSTARAALQLRFVVELESELENGGSQTCATQLVWKFNPNAVASQFDDDWSRLEEHPLVFCRTARDATGAKGGYQTLDLADRKTFVAAFDRDRGSFVGVFRKEKDLAARFRANLEAACTQDLISAGVAASLSERFSRFESLYAECISGFRDGGAAQTRIVDQLQAYAELLEDIVRHAKGDKNRELLLRPILSVGAVQIDNGAPAVVVAPWHPLRLAAMHYKALHVASLVRQLLSSQEAHFGDTRLFFKDLQQELAHPFYPEIVLGWRESQAELLSFADADQDYSLYEPPIVPQGESEGTNENPAEGSNRVIELIERYLSLHPHEQANMSVVLFNCDSARLPQAVVDKIGTLYEDEEDVRCLVLLRHSDAGRLRDLYRAIVAQSDTDADAFNASEATQDFMARLRICIVADQAPAPDPKDGSPYDIVFSQDVIARHACVAWFPEGARPIDADRLIPPRWSRRRPAAKDDMKSVVYLCCPVQTKEGWSYITAVTTFLQGDWDENEDRRLLRQGSLTSGTGAPPRYSRRRTIWETGW
jgi:S-DNA-T family DNA segregation ATPase FtsK/SpoIIIE